MPGLEFEDDSLKGWRGVSSPEIFIKGSCSMVGDFCDTPESFSDTDSWELGLLVPL